jgi:hypothetical protein
MSIAHSRGGTQAVPAAFKAFNLPWDKLTPEARSMLGKGEFSGSENPGFAYALAIELLRVGATVHTVTQVLGLWCTNAYVRKKVPKMALYAHTWVSNESKAELIQAMEISEKVSARAYQVYSVLFTPARREEFFAMSLTEATAELEAATLSKWHRTQIDRALKELVEKHYLVKGPRSGKTQSYRFRTKGEHVRAAR